jgi:hypothetical protein
MKRHFTVLILIMPLFLKAQIGTSLLSSSRFSGMGKASVAVQGAESLFSNPANLSAVNKMTTLLASEWRYGVSDLRPIALGFVKPTPSGVLGIMYQHFGFEVWHDNMLGIAYSRKLAAKLDLGIHLKYQSIRIPANGTQHILGFDIGCNTQIFTNFRLGFHVQNLLPFKINEKEVTPSVFRLGVAYQLNINVLLSLETLKDLSYPANFRFGMEYHTAEKLFLRCGFESQPTSFCFGMSYVLNENFKFDMALSNHAVLGATPSFTVVYSAKK